MNISVGQGDHAACISCIGIPGKSKTFMELLHYAIENNNKKRSSVLAMNRFTIKTPSQNKEAINLEKII